MMETGDPEPSPQSLNFPDDEGLWMKMDTNSVTNHAQTPPATPGQKNQDEAHNIPAASAVIARYNVMDEEGADDVFIPLPPPFPPPPPPPPLDCDNLLPAEGGTDTMANNSAVTLSKEAADATEAKANPDGLDWHHGDKQVMATQREVDEDRAGAGQTSRELMDNSLLSNDQDFPPPTYLNKTSMDDTDCLTEECHDAAATRHSEDSADNEESNEDILILREGQENWGETDAERDKCAKKRPSNQDPENLENETGSVKEGDEMTSEGVCDDDDKESIPSGENLDCNSVATTGSTLPSVSADEEDLELSEEEEPWESDPNKAEASQPQMDNQEGDDDESADIASLDHDLAKCELSRRESGGMEMQGPRLSISKGSEDVTAEGEQEDGSKRIASDIQQGEQLLQRLQMLQLRHDAHISENPPSSPEVGEGTRPDEEDTPRIQVQDWRVSGTNQSSEEEQEEDEEKTLSEEEDHEKNDSEDIEEKEKSLSGEEKDQQQRDRTDGGDPNDVKCDRWKAEDLPPTDPYETSPEIPFLSMGHRLSAAETSIERQIQEAAQKKQNLQRAGGVFNLADDEDVLEIPFKTNISLESLLTKAAVAQRSSFQFSEQKMQKEISQEIQREQVLVNQGTIPGGYSKGEFRQLKETKLLFEAFQQDNTEGPTRHRKLPVAVAKGPMYPSVLERTRSLEMFSMRSVPVSRAHSFRMYNSTAPEREKSLENLRIKSPTGGVRDKTRLAPYSKQDKHLRLHRSMDSINTNVSQSNLETNCKTKEEIVRKKSPLLQQNPFVKLRPALALQPEMEKDIRESKEREEELRRQRSSLYGEMRQNNEDEDRSRCPEKLIPDAKRQSRGKLERVWPPPTKKDQIKTEQQEPKVQRAGGQRAPLWQRWESGLINGQPPKDKK